MKLGLFGGSFDPPHNGHLVIASDAAEALALDSLVFIPTGAQPLKQGEMAASPADRLAMVQRLVEGDPRFTVDPVEIERGGLSYTVDTLAAYAQRYPSAERFLLLGADAYATIGKWREPDRIRELATLVVMQRADGRGGEVGMPPMARSRREPEDQQGVIRLAGRRIDISSTEIRERVRRGVPIHGFVPGSVAEYIRAAGLYR